jgi:protein O-mannosyl-transferase
LKKIRYIINKHQTIFQIIALAIVILICYANIMQSPFLWDDEEMVMGNPTIRSWEYLPNIFTSSAFGNKFSEGKFYRPIQISSYLIDYHFWQLNPLGYHLSSILIHFGASILLLFLFRSLGMSSILAFLGAIIFAIHPSGIESVTYISGRGDVLCVFFAILTFNLFLLASKKKSYVTYLLSACTYAISILAKENVVPLPLIISAYLLLNRNNLKNFCDYFGISLLNIIMACYISFRLFSIGLVKSSTLSYIATATNYEQILTIPKIIITYLHIFFFPINLHMEYHFVETSLKSSFIWAGLPILILTILIFLKHLKPKNSTLFFGLWFFLGLGMVYNFPIALASTVREHWLYFPQIGLIGLILLFIQQSLSKLKNKKTIPIIILVPIILFWSTATIIRNKDWQLPINLYIHDVKLEPKSFLLHNNLGVELYRKKDFRFAKYAFIKSIETSPNKAYGTAYNNLGVIIEHEGDIKQAITLYEKSILHSKYQLAYNNLGRVLIQTNKPKHAISILEEGLSHYRLNLEMKYYLILAYYYSGKINTAKKLFYSMPPTSHYYRHLYETLNN